MEHEPFAVTLLLEILLKDIDRLISYEIQYATHTFCKKTPI